MSDSNLSSTMTFREEIISKINNKYEDTSLFKIFSDIYYDSQDKKLNEDVLTAIGNGNKVYQSVVNPIKLEGNKNAIIEVMEAGSQDVVLNDNLNKQIEIFTKQINRAMDEVMKVIEVEKKTPGDINYGDLIKKFKEGQYFKYLKKIDKMIANDSSHQNIMSELIARVNEMMNGFVSTLRTKKLIASDVETRIKTELDGINSENDNLGTDLQQGGLRQRHIFFDDTKITFSPKGGVTEPPNLPIDEIQKLIGNILKKKQGEKKELTLIEDHSYKCNLGGDINIENGFLVINYDEIYNKIKDGIKNINYTKESNEILDSHWDIRIEEIKLTGGQRLFQVFIGIIAACSTYGAFFGFIYSCEMVGTSVFPVVKKFWYRCITACICIMGAGAATISTLPIWGGAVGVRGQIGREDYMIDLLDKMMMADNDTIRKNLKTTDNDSILVKFKDNINQLVDRYINVTVPEKNCKVLCQTKKKMSLITLKIRIIL